MADFPSNLDDGELWLPSEIFHNELSSMEDLAQRVAALAFLERRRSQTLPKPPPNLVRFIPPVRYGSASSLPDGCFGFNGGFGLGLYGFGVEGLWTGYRPVYSVQVVNSVQPQVECVVEARARVLSREQNRVLQNRVWERPVLPLQGRGLGGGLEREYGGTGVFLPRIGTTKTTTRARTTTSTLNVRSQQSVRNRQEIQVIPHRSPIKMVDVRKQEECHYHLPPEMGLPQDWTY
ncbi:Vegetative cell wall protein like [Actinidia chinensis var. chinensis]|uniref:Vegetative cell wall protein like n=1 Tax=Actinidia chinensis var. chinensis TaxID=1590841 RepID=A0A2R6R638_ACTCC|nr:Vegetative cell wall protein like [Actinidia chinensis var. chinensis]